MGELHLSRHELNRNYYHGKLEETAETHHYVTPGAEVHHHYRREHRTYANGQTELLRWTRWNWGEWLKVDDITELEPMHLERFPVASPEPPEEPIEATEEELQEVCSTTWYEFNRRRLRRDGPDNWGEHDGTCWGAITNELDIELLEGMHRRHKCP